MAVDFLTYAAEHNFAFLKIYPNLKRPVGDDWQNAASTDPTDWKSWQATGHNTGIHSGKSNLIVADLDVKDGRDEVWAAWQKLCADNGDDAEKYHPHVSSPSDGWHIWFKVDPGLNLSKKVPVPNIELRGGNHNSVLPPSYYDAVLDGKPHKKSGLYRLYEPLPPPHKAPPWMVALCTVTDITSAAPSPDTARTVEELLPRLPAHIRRKLDCEDATGDRSQDISICVTALIGHGCSDSEIFDLIWSRPLGEKAREKRDDGKWLRGDIQRMRGKGFGASPSAVEMFNGVPATTGGTTPAPEDEEPARVAIEDFVAFLPMHQYIYIPTRALWPASSVNSALPAIQLPMQPKPTPAASYLDKHRAVQCLTWAPGRPMEIRDELVDEGGWIAHPGATTFNEYRAPTIGRVAGDPSPWLDHVKHLFGEDANHIIKWCAHRVQFPAYKVNHALVLGGEQGIGKDSTLEPVKFAVGPWNFKEVGPEQILGQFNGFVKSVVLRISEARDLGDSNRHVFYERIKTLTAAPPDMLRVNEKFIAAHHVPNLCGVVITSNHADALQLPPDDRRHFVAWSPVKKDSFPVAYWDRLYGWFANGGNEIVADYLWTLDLSEWDAKAPPPKTQAWREMVDISRAPEDAELDDALDKMKRPKVVTISAVLTVAGTVSPLGEFLRDARRNGRNIPKRFKACAYVPVRNPDADSGLWRVAGKRQMIYAQKDMSLRDQLTEARQLVALSETAPSLPEAARA